MLPLLNVHYGQTLKNGQWKNDLMYSHNFVSRYPFFKRLWKLDGKLIPKNNLDHSKRFQKISHFKNSALIEKNAAFQNVMSYLGDFPRISIPLRINELLKKVGNPQHVHPHENSVRWCPFRFLKKSLTHIIVILKMKPESFSKLAKK